MHSLVRSRIHAGAGVVLVIIIMLLVQNALSDNISIGSLAYRSSSSFSTEEAINLLWEIVKVLAFVPVMVAWALDKRRWLGISVVLSNALLTFQLTVSALLLVITLGEDTSAQAYLLIQDTLLVMLLNVLIFSLWYWLIDSPGIKKRHIPRVRGPGLSLFPEGY